MTEGAGQGVAGVLIRELARVFRHMLPGALVVGGILATRPEWLGLLLDARLDYTSGWTVAVLGAVALTLGNVWYVFHRYTVHNLLDYVWWGLHQERGARSVREYLAWLMDHIDASFHLPPSARRLERHVFFRSSQIILMFITAEVLIAASVLSLLGTPRCAGRNHLIGGRISGWVTLGMGFAAFLCAMAQHYVSHRLDIHVVERHVTGPE